MEGIYGLLYVAAEISEFTFLLLMFTIEKCMGVKSDVLHFLMEKSGEYVSGEAMAEKLSVSRMSICKAVQALEREGYAIEASKRLGYRVINEDVLSADTIRHYLRDGIGVYFFKDIDSTNNKAKELAVSGVQTPFAVVAECQHGGKGRLGRAFTSPAGGLYFSICLSGREVPDPDLLTTSASLAVARALEKAGRRTEIKWVNDLYYDGKKCTGILTEGIVNMEAGGLDKAIIGIGINYETPASSFAPELIPIVTSLYPDGGAPVSRAEMIAACIESVIDIQGTAFLDEYRSRCFIIGCDLNVIKAGNVRHAHAVAVDDRGHLVVSYEDGAEEALSSGEVTLKL